MADLKHKDRVLLEKALVMESGWVLDFSDRTFGNFIAEVLNFDVHEKYRNCGSKANKMRAIWKIESNEDVVKLLENIADTYIHKNNEFYEPITNIIAELKSQCQQIKNHERIRDFKFLQDFINDANEHYQNGKYWPVITNARTILEITFEEICKRRSLTFNDKSIITTFKNIRKYFGMDAKNIEYPDYIKCLISNTVTLVNSIAEVRNKASSSHAPKYKPKKHHAKFYLEQSLSLMNFIISVDESKK